MNLRQYYVSMALGTLVSWVSWGVLVFLIDPYYAGGIILFLFYLTLFCALLGTASFTSLFARFSFQHTDAPMYHIVGRAFFDATMVAISLCVFLWLFSHGWLTLWTGGTLLFVVCSFVLFRVIERRETYNRTLTDI